MVMRKGQWNDDETELASSAIAGLAKELGNTDLTGRSWFASFTEQHGVLPLIEKIRQLVPWRGEKSVRKRLSAMMQPPVPPIRKGTWTRDEEDTLRLFVARNGEHSWREIGLELHRAPTACAKRWRTKLSKHDVRSGAWSDQEAALLKLLINKYMTWHKEHPEDSPLTEPWRDRIAWSEIAIAHGTRDEQQCRSFWRSRLYRFTISEGLWDPADDVPMLSGLFASDATDVDAVDWGELVQGRDAKLTYRRFMEFIEDIPNVGDFRFTERIEWLRTANAGWMAQEAEQAAAGARDLVIVPACQQSDSLDESDCNESGFDEARVRASAHGLSWLGMALENESDVHEGGDASAAAVGSGPSQLAVVEY